MMNVKSLMSWCGDPTDENLGKLGLYETYFVLNLCLRLNSGDFGEAARLNFSKNTGAQRAVGTVLRRFRTYSFPPVPSISSEEAAEYLDSFSVALTGARAGESLVGIANVTKGAVIRIHREDVLPNYEAVAPIKKHEEAFQKLLEKMKLFPALREMTRGEISKWFASFSNPRKAFIGEDGNRTRIELVQPGLSNFSKLLSQEDLETLLSGKSFELGEIEDMFPRKAGSKARHPTLMFMKHWWKVIVDYNIADSFDGACIDLYTGKVLRGFAGGEKKKVFVIEDVSVSKNGTLGFVTAPSPVALDRKVLIGVMNDLLGESAGAEYEKIAANFKNYTPATYKSLLQKIIRFRARRVVLTDGSSARPEAVLLAVLSELILHPGAFVPDIQRFVSGVESAAKRLAVTIFEDSHFDRDEDSVALLGSALLCQRYKNYKPDRELLKKWFEIALRGLGSDKVYRWKTEKKYASYVIDADNSPLETASALLDEVKSFASDLNMVSYLASSGYDLSPPPGKRTPRPEAMPIYHATDQHWAPNIAYYFDEGVPTFGDGSFGKFYKDIFYQVTGVNPRRDYTKDFGAFEREKFVEETRRAQLRILSVRQSEVRAREVLNKNYVMRERLNVGWLAGLVGVIEIKSFFVTMSYEDPYNLAVVKRPSREVKDGHISPEDYEMAIREAKKKLAEGIKIKKNQLPSKDFEKASVRLEGGEYYIIKGGYRVPWEEFRNIKVSVPFQGGLDDFWDALSYEGTGLVPGAWEKLNLLLEGTDVGSIKRVLMYVSSYDTEVELNHINIKGESLHLSVNDMDLCAFQFMLKVSALFPGALSPKKYTPITFRVNTPLLLWRVRRQITLHAQRKEKVDVEGWKGEGNFVDSLKRKPWEHQTSALEEMKSNFLQGSRGNFIWIPVGMGKTAIALSFAAYLFRSGKLPPYIIYSMPSSAIQSVINEIRAFGLKVNLHIPLKNIKGRKLPTGAKIKQNSDFEPFAVSVVEQDHLRLCRSRLVEIAGASVVIMDEVHKTLNETQRTSVALEICYLSYQFVAMTGTPVIDNKIYKLLAWLKQIVPFAIDEKNFWVAVNSMVSRKVNTGVLVERSEVLALFGDGEERAYQKLVGPAIGGFNKSSTHEDIRRAIEICYDASTRAMVEKVRSLLKKKRGVMVVAKNREHQLELEGMIGEFEKRVYLIEKGGSIFLTDESVEKGGEDYRVVITTVRHSEGYTLTRLNSFVSGIYFSNGATREQLEGRINRIGQRAKQVDYFYVHCGILTYVYEKYKSVRGLNFSMESAIRDIIKR